jgi:thiol-disulfide isomerase/thioredoxin
MRIRIQRFLALLAVLALVPFSAFAQSDAADTADTSAEDMPYVLDAFQGTALDLTQYQGKAIWLNFFTGWCPYCMTEMPYIRQIFDNYDPEQLAIVLVHVWDGEDAAEGQAVAAEYGLQEMIMVEDEDLALSNLVGLQGYPTSFFIDKEEYLYASTYGLDYDGMAAYMEELGVGTRAVTTDAVSTPTAVPESGDATSSATTVAKP